MNVSTRPLMDTWLLCYEKIDPGILHPANVLIVKFSEIASQFFSQLFLEREKEPVCRSVALRVARKKAIHKVNTVQRAIRRRKPNKSHKPRKYESYSNLAKIRFLKKAAGGIVTNKPIDLKKAKKAAHDLEISWSTAKSWIKKHDEYRLTFGKTGMTYVDFLESQGDRLKLGVGRKITYGKEKEEQILSSAIVARENEDKLFTIRDLKQIAREIIGEHFKASDGWAKKFCYRNGFSVGDKFNSPKTLPKDLMKKRNNFLKSYRILSETYTKDRIVFMDKLDLHYSLLKPTTKKKKEKPVTVLFSLSSAGDVLRPFVIFNGTPQEDVNNKYTYVVYTYNEAGRVNFKQIQKWIEECLGSWDRKRKNSRLIIAPNYGFLQGPEVGKVMRTNRTQFLMLPKGLNCVLNPLKSFLQSFLKAIMKSAEGAEKGKNWQELILEWIVDGVNVVTDQYACVLRSAFSCFSIGP